MPSNNWYQGRKIADIANMALTNINQVLYEHQQGFSPDYIWGKNRGLKSACWWMFDYVNGTRQDEIKSLCQNYLSDPSWAEKNNYDHQRIAKIAGFWVPGRPKGSKNKPKQGTATVTEHTVPMPSPASIAPMQMASAVPAPAADAPQDFDPAKLSTMIDTSSMSMSVVWGSVVTLLMAAERNDRPEEDKVILRDTISVLKELI
jgi:hypothetical protein